MLMNKCLLTKVFTYLCFYYSSDSSNHSSIIYLGNSKAIWYCRENKRKVNVKGIPPGDGVRVEGAEH